MVEDEGNSRKREVLKGLVKIPRIWLQQNLSHPFKLPGIVLFHCLEETIDAIMLLREKEDHEVLESLEIVLRNSIEDVAQVAGDISQAEVWTSDICDILLGQLDKNRQRNTDEYKKKMTGEKIAQKLFEYILNLEKRKQQYSQFLQETIQHFRTVHNNWKKHLFTCYDSKFLPNTNLELELSHSRMKRKHRKITGLKNSHQFMLIHGEHFSFCFEFQYSYDLLVSILQSANYKNIQAKTKEERAKSQSRGQTRLTLKNLPKKLEEITASWG